MKVLENNAKFVEIESRLTKFSFLSRNSLPGFADGKIFQILQSNKRFPDRRSYPNFYHWYIVMKQFSPASLSKWISKQLYYDPSDQLVSDFALVNLAKNDTQVQISSLCRLRSSTELSPKSEKFVKQQSTSEIEYIMDITPKDSVESVIEILRKELEPYKVDFIEQKDKKQIRIAFRAETAKCQEIKNKISRSIQFQNMNVKKQKKIKQSQGMQIN